jgi:hypothetical protein
MDHPTLLYWIGMIGYKGETVEVQQVQSAICHYLESFDYAGVRDMIVSYVPIDEMACTTPYFRAPTQGSSERKQAFTLADPARSERQRS